jgi:hypothetical protein
VREERLAVLSSGVVDLVIELVVVFGVSAALSFAVAELIARFLGRRDWHPGRDAGADQVSGPPVAGQGGDPAEGPASLLEPAQPGPVPGRAGPA